MYSTVLADAVASRVGRMIDAMSRVAQGQLSERLQPIGNDEIDVLARHFKRHGARMEHNDTPFGISTSTCATACGTDGPVGIDDRGTSRNPVPVDRRCASRGHGRSCDGVLHNVGNVLNSVNISVSILKEQIRRSKVSDLQGFTTRLAARAIGSRASWPRRTAARSCWSSCSVFPTDWRRSTTRSCAKPPAWRRKSNISRALSTPSKPMPGQVPFREKVHLEQLIDDVLKLHSESLRKHEIDIELAIEECRPSIWRRQAAAGHR